MTDDVNGRNKDFFGVGAPINIYEYYYLKGDKDYWPCWGAAYAMCSEWCKSRGYGTFGNPTTAGNARMTEYERDHKL
jgi:hypothetical protein